MSLLLRPGMKLLLGATSQLTPWPSSQPEVIFLCGMHNSCLVTVKAPGAVAVMEDVGKILTFV